MAVTCAVTVANLYYAQPLLHSIGDSLHVSQGSAALLVTLGQLGYAAGLLFIVPAGDIMRRRPLLTGLLAFCAVTLARRSPPTWPRSPPPSRCAASRPWSSRCSSPTRRRWRPTTSAAG
jgi:MFS family permease